MIGVILYTLIEFLNYYLAYRNVLGIQFTTKKQPYVIAVVSACTVQLIVLCFVDNTWRDVIALVMGLFGALMISEGERWKIFLLYPIASFLPSLVSVLASYAVAALLGMTQKVLCNSIGLTLLCECMAVVVFIIYGRTVKNREEMSLTLGQYVILLAGVICFFLIVTFSQGLLRDDMDFINETKNLVAVACTVIALFFIVLSIWQQITWKKSVRYRLDNEKYEMYLNGQEEHIRMLILEDERRRKLRHDMHAHMLALDSMAAKEEWERLREYIQQMKETLGDASVNKYTMISAVDAVIDEWHRKAIKQQAEWSWEGTIRLTDRITIFELCTVFSNLLSNAVETMEKETDGGRIEVKVSNYQEKIVLSIGNTCHETFKGKPMTTKADNVFHGLGLKNVEEIINRHEGSIDYEIRNDWFQVDIVL